MMEPQKPAPNPELMTKRDVCAFFGGISASTLYSGIADGRFPRPIKPTSGMSRWLRSECEASLEAMKAKRNQRAA